MGKLSKDHPVVLFDGDCNLCNGVVKFVIRHDPQGIFRFAPLQSSTGEYLRSLCRLDDEGLDTFILVEGDRGYVRSTAALHLFRLLGGRWRWLYGLIVVPRAVRDAVYSYIARNRIKWFGAAQQCMMPNPLLESRFLINGKDEN